MQAWRRGWALSFGIMLAAVPVSSAAPPNIVLYISDDHSQVDSSVYGDVHAPMPFLAKLAAQGVTMTGAFTASPSCACSRAAMLTGLMPARNGAVVNHTLPIPGVPCLVKNLQALGYEVAAFGKVAHSPDLSPWGFDTAELAPNCPQLGRNVRRYFRNRNSTKPLLLMVGISSPHVPWSLPASGDPSALTLPPTFVDTPATRAHRARYLAEVKEVDEFLGELEALTQAKLGADTALIYTSDHGAQWPFGKWTLYDYGTRVPLVIRWPGLAKVGTKNPALVSLVDLLPTLVELAGGTPPNEIDGESFASVLRGDTQQHRAEVFTTHTADGDVNVYPARAIRTAEWKLIHNLHSNWAFTNHSDLHRRPNAGAYWTEWAARGGEDPLARAIVDRYYQRPEFELYRVSVDPWEQHNLASDPQHAVQLTALKEMLADWRRQQADEREPELKPRRLTAPATWRPDLWNPARVPPERTPPTPTVQGRSAA